MMTASESDATTAQGLRPMMAALTAAGIPFDVDQTGGMCMAINVAASRGRYLLITAFDCELSELFQLGDLVAICAFSASDPNDEGTIIARDARIADAIRVVLAERA